MTLLIDITAILYIFAAFIWSFTDIYKRSHKNEKPVYDWMMVLVFLFNFIFMPVLAATEKVLDSDDYYRAIKDLFQN